MVDFIIDKEFKKKHFSNFYIWANNKNKNKKNYLFARKKGSGRTIKLELTLDDFSLDDKSISFKNIESLKSEIINAFENRKERNKKKNDVKDKGEKIKKKSISDSDFLEYKYIIKNKINIKDLSIRITSYRKSGVKGKYVALVEFSRNDKYYKEFFCTIKKKDTVNKKLFFNISHLEEKELIDCIEKIL